MQAVPTFAPHVQKVIDRAFPCATELWANNVDGRFDFHLSGKDADGSMFSGWFPLLIVERVFPAWYDISQPPPDGLCKEMYPWDKLRRAARQAIRPMACFYAIPNLLDDDNYFSGSGSNTPLCK